MQQQLFGVIMGTEPLGVLDPDGHFKPLAFDNVNQAIDFCQDMQFVLPTQQFKWCKVEIKLPQTTQMQQKERPEIHFPSEGKTIYNLPKDFWKTDY